MIAYPGSIGRLHYGEEGEKGFLLWEVGAAIVRFALIHTPALRTVEISFDGLPDLEELKTRAQEAKFEGAFVRVRWTCQKRIGQAWIAERSRRFLRARRK